MACLQQSYGAWMNDEPDEPGDHPTEDELAGFENEEKLHQEKVSKIVSLSPKVMASFRLSHALSSAL